MKWLIPAKTFLLGEYVALLGGSAVIVTTQPCFEIRTSNLEHGLTNIHPDSPAGKWWSSVDREGVNLVWHDPYNGLGGLGASSAQFVGVFRAWHDLKQKAFTQQDLLTAYQQYAWDGTGQCPSGYDVLAQALHGCVVIDKDLAPISYPWKFADLAFILIHTGHKLATHQHLSTLELSSKLHELNEIADLGLKAFTEYDADQLIFAVNAYHRALLQMNLVAEHSQKIITQLQQDQDVLAIKGCGAMGADIICVLINQKKLNTMLEKLLKQSYSIITTSNDIKL
jgi:mevalonate kinase